MSIKWANTSKALKFRARHAGKCCISHRNITACIRSTVPMLASFNPRSGSWLQFLRFLLPMPSFLGQVWGHSLLRGFPGWHQPPKSSWSLSTPSLCTVPDAGNDLSVAAWGQQRTALRTVRAEHCGRRRLAFAGRCLAVGLTNWVSQKTRRHPRSNLVRVWKRRSCSLPAARGILGWKDLAP